MSDRPPVAEPLVQRVLIIVFAFGTVIAGAILVGAFAIHSPSTTPVDHGTPSNVTTIGDPPR